MTLTVSQMCAGFKITLLPQGHRSLARLELLQAKNVSTGSYRN